MRRNLLIIVLFVIGASIAVAHPHMWIRGGLTPVLGAEGLAAVEIRWAFDEFNSSALIDRYDADGDGDLNSLESRRAREGSFDHLLADEYYLIIDIDGLRGTPQEARDFRAEVVDGQLVYSFIVPLEIPIRWPDLPDTGIYLFDPSYFIDFRQDEIQQIAAVWEERELIFSVVEMQLATQGYGEVLVRGLKVSDGTAGGLPGQRLRFSPGVWLKDVSFTLQEKLAGYTRLVLDDRRPGAFWAAMALAFVFGLVHVLGPGHGKSFTLAYFSSKRAKLSEGLALSALINILDSISAFLVVGLIYGILSLTIQDTGAAVTRITRIVAYSGITLLGTFFFILHLGHRHDHSHDETPVLKPWILALSVGLVPCPVSTALLAYGIAESALWFSLLLVVAVSLGGMVALTAYSLAIIGGKSVLVHGLQHREDILEWFELASMGLLAVFGVILLIGVV